MGRFKINQEREAKRVGPKTDEEKEQEEMFTEIRQVPGWTGDHEKDMHNPGIQNIIRRKYQRQKV